MATNRRTHSNRKAGRHRDKQTNGGFGVNLSRDKNSSLCKIDAGRLSSRCFGFRGGSINSGDEAALAKIGTSL